MSKPSHQSQSQIELSPIQKTGLTLGILILVMILGGLLRFWQLDKIVPILNRDEAALAYNALLLREAGVDEWGEKWPINLRSFGDYKLIGYPTLLVVAYHFLPISDVTVRLPSALAGTLLIGLSYLVARQFGLRRVFSLLFSLTIALSPFAIFYSRFAYEANVALFYIVAGLWLWLITVKSLRRRFVIDAVGIIFWIMAMLTYNSPFLLLIPVVLALCLHRLTLGWKWWLPLLLGSIVALISIAIVLFPVISQKSGISLMTDPLVQSQFGAYRNTLPSALQPILGNQYVYWLTLSAQNAWESFSPAFLFQRIFHPWHGVPQYGQLLWPVVITGWLGIIAILVSLIRHFWQSRRSFDKVKQVLAKPSFLLAVLILISLLPAAITVDAPHATRSLLFLYLFCLLATWFMQKLTQWWRTSRLVNKRSSRLSGIRDWLFVGIYILFLLLVASQYWSALYTHYPQEARMIFKAGFDEIILANSDRSDVDSRSTTAIVDDEGYQYILFAWYKKLAPDKFLNSIQRGAPSVVGLRYGERLANYHFISQTSDREESESPLIQWNEEFNQWEVKP